MISASGALAQTASFDHADCWLKTQSGYGVSFFGTNPTDAELRTAVQELAAKYHVPVQIIAAVCQQESSAFQYGADGFVTHNLAECKSHFASPTSDAPPGLGLMQLTGATARQFDVPRVITDWRYNLECGVQVLIDKYEVAAAREEPVLQNSLRANADVIENWFYPLAHYNGFSFGNPYPFDVYGWISTVPPRFAGLYTAVTPTPPASVITDWAYSDTYAATRAGSWRCAHGNTFTGTVHVGSGAGTVALPTVSVTVGAAAIASGQSTFVGAADLGGAGPAVIVTVTNNGGQVLTWSPSLTASAYTITEVTGTSLRVGESGSFKLTLVTDQPGLRLSTVQITSNAVAGPFRFGVRGRVVPPETPFADFHHAECWLESSSGYGGSFYGTNPTNAELREECAKQAALFNVPVEIVAATAMQMSSGFQYGRDGFVSHDVSRCVQLFRGSSGGPPPLGIMRLGGATANLFDVPRMIADWRYALRAGVRILVDQYDIASSADPAFLRALELEHPAVLENWYYPLAVFAGNRNDDEFTLRINDWIEAPPPRIAGAFTPVFVTLPAAVVSDWTPGHSFVALPSGDWRCGHDLTFQGPVHRGSGLDELTPAHLTVTGPGGALTSGQSAAVDTGTVARGAAATPVSFTIANDGGGVIDLAVRVPAGYEPPLLTRDRLYAGESATLTLKLDTARGYRKAGTVQIDGYSATPVTFTFPVQGFVTTPPYTFSVTSSNPDSGVPIAADSADINGVSHGTTPFSMTYPEQATVVLTTPYSISGKVFDHWERDGANVGGGTVYEIAAESYHAFKAVYRTAVPPGATQTTNYFHEECWLRRTSNLGVTFTGANPTAAQLQTAMRQLSVQHQVPLEIIAAVCQQESSAFQYGADGFVVHNVGECVDLFRGTATGAPPGLGLMQLTGATAQAFEVGRLVTDWRYNLDAGVRVLKDKYAVAVDLAPAGLREQIRNNSKTLENWFYPLGRYNGFFVGNPYPYRVYDYIATPPARITGLFSPVTVTPPEAAVADWTYGHGYVALPTGQWLCEDGVSSTAAVHAGSGVDAVVRTLAVETSTPDSGVSVTASTPDTQGRAGGTTPFALTHLTNATLTLTAPATAGARTFARWQRDGVDVPNATRTLSVTADADHVYRAIYRGATPSLRINDLTGSATVAASVAFDVSVVDWSGNTSEVVALFAASGGAALATRNVAGATARFTAPASAGAYTLKLMSGTTVLATSSTLTVPPPPPPVLTLNGSAAPLSLQGGASFTCNLSYLLGNPLDWLAVTPESAPDSGWVSYAYVTGTAMTLVAPSAPGVYQVRLRSAAGGPRLSVSPTITVLPPVVQLNGGSSALSVSPGATVQVTVQGWSGNKLDWIGVTPEGAPDSGWVSFAYVTANTLAVTLPRSAGNYELRLRAAAGGARLAVSPRVTVVPPPPPVMTLGDGSAQSVRGGATIPVTIANLPGNSGDWLGVCPAGAADTAWVTFTYAKTAAVNVVAPLAPGTYTVRFRSGVDGSRLATSAEFTVLPPRVLVNGGGVPIAVPGGASVSITVDGWSGNTNDWVGVTPEGAPDSGWLSFKYVTAQTFSVTMPAIPGTYDVRLRAAQGSVKLATSARITVLAPSLTVNGSGSPVSVTPGSRLTVDVANWSGNTGDWVSACPIDAPDSGWVTYAYVTGSSVALAAPTAPGVYNVRLRSAAGNTRVAVSATVTVLPPVVSVNGGTAPITVSPGATVTVNIQGWSGNPLDWVGVTPLAAPDPGWLSFKYVTTTTFTVTMPQAAGDYNVRLRAAAGGTRLATSATISVR